MELVVSLSTILKDIIRNVEDDKTKRDFVTEHIRNVKKNCFSEIQLPQGQDWFNVSRPLTENDLRGKVVVLDFFTYCCINCLHLIPHLRALENQFSVADGVVVIGIHSAKFENEKKSSNIALALKRHNIIHPVINDSSGFMWDKMKISCWPTIVIIGPEGQVLFVLIGEQCRDELFLYVESTLKYYRNEVSSHLLPINENENIITSNILSFPGKIARFENILALSDSGNHRVLVIDDSGYVKFKIGGKSSGFQDGSFQEAKFNSPQGIAFFSKSKIFVADSENHAVRLIDLSKSVVKTVAGTGVQGTDYVGGKHGTTQEISSPWDLCFVPSNHVKETCFGIQLLPPDNSKIPTRISNFLPSPPPPPPPPFLPGSAPAPYVLPSTASAEENAPKRTQEYATMKNVLLIAMSGIHQIWALFLEDTVWWKGVKYEKDVCVAIAGSGKEENRNNSYPMMASFAQPSGLAYSARLKCVFIADSESSSIRKLSLEDGSVSHVVGGDKNPVDLFNFGDVDGKGYNAKLQHPLGLTFSEKNNILYVCDTYNNKLKRIDLTTFECISFDGGHNVFNEPNGCVLDEAEQVLFITDTNNNSVATYNVKEKVLGNLVVREKEPHDSNWSECKEWEMETEIDSKGGSLTVMLHLGPEDVHGSWKLDVNNSNIEGEQLKGQISSIPQELKLRVLPTDSRDIDTANIFFNLAFCEKDVCLFKKFLLKLNIRRSQNGSAINKVEFRKTVR